MKPSTLLLSLTTLMSLTAQTLQSATELPVSTSPSPQPEGAFLIYVGGYTTRDNPGIRVGRLDPATGRVHGLRLAAEIRNPSFLALHPSKEFLYAVTETNEQNGRAGGGVSAFSIRRDSGDLQLLNTESTRGGGPCHVLVDASGRCLLVANYGGGSIVSFTLSPEGRLSPAVSFHQHSGSSVHPTRQRGPHAHGAYPDPESRFALVPDLGLDRIVLYRLEAHTGRLSAHEPSSAAMPPGAGPRHLAFNPAGTHVYVVNELDSTVSVLRWDSSSGTLTPLQQITTLPPGFEAQNTTAEIAVHPNGRFLFASNRGHDSIAVFQIDAETGQLNALGHRGTQGRTPRHFALDPTGQWLIAANQDSDNIVVMRVDRATGQLGDPRPPVPTPKPSCILLVGPVSPTP